MTASDLSAVVRAIDAAEQILVTGHVNPDGDCVGSAVALCEIAEALGKKASLVFPMPLPVRLAFLLCGREVLPALPEDLDAYTVFCVDVASPAQLGDLADALSGRVAVRIDHHEIGASYAKEEFVDPSAAATGEILFDLCEYLAESGRLSAVPPRAAYAAYGAISSDTGCFKYANITEGTHLRAAKLLALGVNASEINRLLFETKNFTQLRAEGIALSRLRMFADGKIACISVEKSDYTDGVTLADFETAVDIARSVRGSVAAAVVKASPVQENTYRVSLRSAGINVAEVAARFGGGGHIRAAGCTLTCETAEEAVKRIVSALTEAIEKA